MSIEIRKAESREIKNNIIIVRKMTGGMSFDENMEKVNWRSVRIISDFGYRFMPKEKGIRFHKIKTANCRFEVVNPCKISNDNIICYIHGGGFVSGSAGSSRGYSSMLASYSNSIVIAIDYSLAPEKPFPYGFNDCCSAIEEIQNRYPKSKISLVGESAGANLCIAVALKMKNNSISSVTVHSPIIDFTNRLDRSEHEIDDFTVKEGCLKPLNRIYIGNNSPDDPYISPYYGDFTDFPPTFITCDYNETLFADSMCLYRKLEEMQIEVKMIQMKGAFHAFATTGTQTPETKQILIENIKFIKKNSDLSLK